MRLIDADALIESVCHTADLGGWIGDTLRQIKRLAVRYINSAPTIDAVSVVRGEWIHNPQIGWGETWVCSICGEKTTSSFMGKPRYEYCPMCGARMDGERKESE